MTFQMEAVTVTEMGRNAVRKIMSTIRLSDSAMTLNAEYNVKKRMGLIVDGGVVNGFIAPDIEVKIPDGVIENAIAGIKTNPVGTTENKYSLEELQKMYADAYGKEPANAFKTNEERLLGKILEKSGQ